MFYDGQKYGERVTLDGDQKQRSAGFRDLTFQWPDFAKLLVRTIRQGFGVICQFCVSESNVEFASGTVKAREQRGNVICDCISVYETSRDMCKHI